MTQINGQVKILSAPPGFGKSTLGAHCPSATVVSADDVQREAAAARGLDYDNGGEGFDPSLNAVSHPTCMRRFMAALGDGVELVVVDNTNVSAWEIAPYMLVAQAYDYEVEIVRVVCDPDKAFARQRHGVPRHAFDRMVESFNARDSDGNLTAYLPWWNVRVVEE